jgi:hypothetical protein
MPGWGWKCPATHALQDVDMAADWYLPAGHWRHVAGPALAVATPAAVKRMSSSRKNPGAHGSLHKVSPSA